jgi:hypothetical protein
MPVAGNIPAFGIRPAGYPLKSLMSLEAPETGRHDVTIFFQISLFPHIIRSWGRGFFLCLGHYRHRHAYKKREYGQPFD